MQAGTYGPYSANDDALASFDSLREILLPDGWYIDSAAEHEAFAALDDGWVCVCTPDGGVMAAFPQHHLAVGWLLTACYGSGRPLKQYPTTITVAA